VGLRKAGLAVRSRGLSKVYRIGKANRVAETFAGTIAGWFRYPLENFRAIRRLSQFDDEDGSDIIWAVRDLDFDVHVGEVVGVIGRNGAGKSTLLKILSRITEPSDGRVEISGRVASLLEVGTGFHQELTGRENVYLNGAILGMTHREIDEKFDQIVRFSGVERFLDTPIKRYSSGMKVRLAFSVAAHLEAEILLIDEVLAVGDQAFQRRCLGKMDEVAKSGRTVLFVSHSMEAVQRLCNRTLWLDQGRVVADGDTSAVVQEYLQQWRESLDSTYRAEDMESGAATLTSARLLDAAGTPTEHLSLGEPFSIEMRWQHHEAIPGAVYYIRVFDNRERLLFAANTSDTRLELDTPGEHRVNCKIESNVLTPGDYSVTLGCIIPPRTTIQHVDRALGFSVIHHFLGDVRHIPGNVIFAPPFSWSSNVGPSKAAT